MERSIPELQTAMQAGTVTARDLVSESLARIDAYDDRGPALNTMLAINPRALEAADALDVERRAKGPRGPLHGIPVVIKDNYETADMPTTGGSLALAGFETGRDAFQVRRLREAGAVILGKTNLHELAYGLTSASSLGGQTRNPYDPARNPGGSSGGTAAAVAASFVAAGMGTDTCGSIRIPAAHNNLFGLRVTPGLSSGRGIIPLSHSQDVAGPLARSVIDLVIMLDATVGVDPEDPATVLPVARPRSYMSAVGDSSLRGIRIGRLVPLFGAESEDEEVAAIAGAALDALADIGADVVDVAMPDLQELLQGTGLINAEFKFDLLDYFRDLPGAPVRSLADILADGRYHPVVETVFKRAESAPAPDSDETRLIHERRQVLRARVIAVMDELRLDALAYPPVRRVAAPVGEPQPGANCQLSAATGLPAISMPSGFSDAGLPIGIELLARPFREPRLLAVAYAYEQAVRPRRAPGSTPPLTR